MKRVAVIGGGISGLAAAYTLEKERGKGTQVECALFESGDRLGGVIRTEHVDDCVIEAGPDSFLTEKRWAADLCRELDLGDQLIGSNDAERKTYILIHGRPVAIPDGLVFMVPTNLASAFFSPLFSWGAKTRILREWFYRPVQDERDVTVAEFVQRHYGREMVERLADPLLAAVYGGSADELSVQSVLPRFLEMERSFGSLGKAMAARRSKQPTNAPPLFTSLKCGMQQLTDALVAKIASTPVRLRTAADLVQAEGGKWLVMAEGRTQEFDAVVVATPANVAARLLIGRAGLGGELAAIGYSSSVIAVFVFDEQVRANLPVGFGLLVPRIEKRRMIAATFVHNKFPHRAPENRALIRCFFGGTRDEGVLQMTDAEIETVARRELEQMLGIRSAPLEVRIHKWPDAMAQYEVGHAARAERIRQMVAETPGLALAGNAYSGIGVPDCVRSGIEAARKVCADLGIADRRQAGA